MKQSIFYFNILKAAGNTLRTKKLHFAFTANKVA